MLFRIGALAILSAFYGCYFAKMLGQRKRGIRTDQMGKGKTGFAKGVECTMKVASILVVIAEIVSIVLGTKRFPQWARRVGIGFGGIGVAVFTAAVVPSVDKGATEGNHA